MHTALWVFIAVAIGLMLFATMQEELPSELEFLRLDDSNAVISASPDTDGLPLEQLAFRGWQVQRQGSTLSLSRPFMGMLTVNGQMFDTPQLGLLCHKNALSIRLDSRLPTTGIETTPVVLSGKSSDWLKGAAAMNILASQPAETLKAMLKADGAATFALSYRDLGVQPSQVNTDGLAELVGQMSAGCRPQ